MIECTAQGDNLKRLLFVDDEPHNIATVCKILQDALEVEITIVETVDDAIKALQAKEYTIVITDIFIPMGKNLRQTVGPRARKYEENLRHLGGLALLDNIDKLKEPPKIITHTACTDYALLEILGEHVIANIPKPSPIEVLLKAIRDVLHPPRTWSL